jgi:DNA-binding response OmpR family regulator
MRILLIEDNTRLAELIGTGLRNNGFVIDSFATLADADAALGTVSYEAMILDRGLPDGEGIDFLRKIRKDGKKLPVLVLTARDGIDDRVHGLNAGADDYLLKPFAMEELTARLRALLRRPGHSLGVVLTCGDLAFDTAEREVKIQGNVVSMPKREMEVLEQLLRRPGRVVAKRNLEDSLYGFDDDVTTNSLEAVVSRLRKRLLQAEAAVTVHTLRGVGYMLIEEGAVEQG